MLMDILQANLPKLFCFHNLAVVFFMKILVFNQAMVLRSRVETTENERNEANKTRADAER